MLSKFLRNTFFPILRNVVVNVVVVIVVVP